MQHRYFWQLPKILQDFGSEFSLRGYSGIIPKSCMLFDHKDQLQYSIKWLDYTDQNKQSLTILCFCVNWVKKGMSLFDASICCTLFNMPSCICHCCIYHRNCHRCICNRCICHRILRCTYAYSDVHIQFRCSVMTT